MAPRASWKAYTPWLIDQLKIFANDKTKSIMQSPEEILKLLIAEKELDKQVYLGLAQVSLESAVQLAAWDLAKLNKFEFNNGVILVPY